MQKLLLPVLSLLFSVTVARAQKEPLKGSGIMVNKTFSDSGFDKIELLDLDGDLEILPGKSDSIQVTIDDNLAPLLAVSKENNTLTVKLTGNYENRRYIEETNIRIIICLPSLTSVYHRSNGKLTVDGISGSYVKIRNTGNGNTILKGQVVQADIICRGNGTVNANQLQAASVKVKRSGNGNVYVNTAALEVNDNSGNGSVKNVQTAAH